MDILSLVVGFVVGGFTGAAGTFYGNKYTDQRRQSELIKAEAMSFVNLRNKFPKLLDEMIQDVNTEELSGVREFFIKSKATMLNRDEPYFEYSPSDHPDLQAAIRHMTDLGFIEDITPGNCPMYRFYEHFHEKLKNA